MESHMQSTTTIQIYSHFSQGCVYKYMKWYSLWGLTWVLESMICHCWSTGSKLFDDNDVWSSLGQMLSNMQMPEKYRTAMCYNRSGCFDVLLIGWYHDIMSFPYFSPQTDFWLQGLICLAGNSENQVRYINHRWSCLAVQDIVIAILAAIDNSLSCIQDKRKIPEVGDQYFQRPIRDLKKSKQSWENSDFSPYR